MVSGTVLLDTRFQYDLDNPFADDALGDKKRKLKQYIMSNSETFSEVDYLKTNRYMILFPETNELFGSAVRDSDLSNTAFNNKLKMIISNAPSISPGLKTWASKLDIVPIEQANTHLEEPTQEFTQYNEDTAITNFVPKVDNDTQLNLSKILDGGTIYDMYSERPISYDELRKMTINIARSLRDPKESTDDTLIQLENEERRRLINVIQEFKNVSVISPYIEDDIGRMTVEQLKTLRDKCEKIHSQFKVNEVLKSSFKVCSIAYDALFPEGIPISKTKHIQFGGIGEELKNKLLDNTKTIGFGFSRFLQKHDINITDETTILMAIGEVLVSKAKIVSSPKSRKNKITDIKLSKGETVLDSDSDSASDSSESDLPSLNDV